jgi:DNA invertase Pin-like site-specific DNA recombinase
MKRVRILLRVSSNQQLEADGDLSVQRQLVKEYVESHSDWVLDSKEYFEGSNSGYKNAVTDRDILQEVYRDAEAKEFEILVVYKDDRLGRRMWEIGTYVMSLKSIGVDIYTVKDGCISPNSDDIMGQMVLALRYGNAQKSSSDTGQRVKDTAEKLVQKGKFMGGSAPFGYTLEYSNEISKHGRALKHLVIVPEQAEVVKHIYHLSLDKEYGSTKIAKTLNEDEKYKTLAPNDVWKSGTITSILTNPIYAGHTAYKRRERTNGKYRRLDSSEWVLSVAANDSITIIDSDTWNKVQEKRKKRGDKYIKKLENKDVTVIRRNDGMLALVDVLHCGYCGCKMVNGSKYSYWTIKETGERRTRQIPIYKCQNAWQGVPHDKTKQHRADKIEPIVFDALAKYIARLQRNENVFEQIQTNQNTEKKTLEKIIAKEKQELAKIQQNIDVLESNIPNAMQEKYPLSLEELAAIIHKHKEQFKAQQEVIRQKEANLNNVSVNVSEWQELRQQLPSWQEVFMNADTATKRVLVNKLIERIDITKDDIIIRFKININDFFPQPRISDGFGVSK